MEQKQLYKIEFDGRYRLAMKMKSGAFGTVYLARDKQNKQYAIKVTKGAQNQQFINTEKEIYKVLSNQHTGFVKYYSSGSTLNYQYIVMELLGYDMEDLLQKTKIKKFSLQTACLIGIQVLERLQILHELGYLHRDIKPDNLAIGGKGKTDIVYLLDFGLSKKITNKTNIPNKLNHVVGTYRFMSINCHHGIELSKRDDIQSLGYLLLFFIQGKLPWQNIRLDKKQNFDKLRIMKQKINKNDFTKQPNENFFKFLEYAKKLNFAQTPDYNYLKRLLDDILSSKFKKPFKLQWVGQENLSKSKSKSKKKDSPEPKQVIQKIKRVKQLKKQSPEEQINKQIVAVFKFCATDKLQNQQKQSIYQQIQNEQPKLKKPTQTNLTKIPQKSNYNQRAQSAKRIMQPNDKNNINAMIKTINNMKFSGPRIVINKETMHRI